ncbi:hypothetical protein Mapa_009420 [Marchantia paleacea]|nr:hypothetical protein Mapa_009420 [Marchantia paleacea]
MTSTSDQNGESTCCCVSQFKLREIGTGSSASVFQLYDSNNLPLRLACKVFIKDEKKHLCQEEYEKLKEIGNHDCIVQCVGKPRKFGNLPFLLLGMMTKGSLKQRCDGSPINEKLVRKIIRQILEAVQHIHKLPILHGDIRCANILVGEADHCRLADFGKATKLVDDQGLPGDLGDLCSAFWSAPEVFDPHRTYGLSADIYSVGCTVLELLTGHRPHEDIEFSHAIQAADKIPDIPSTLPQVVRDFIQRCLHQDPGMRPTAKQLLEDPFLRNDEEEVNVDPSKGLPHEDLFDQQTGPQFLGIEFDATMHQNHLDTCCVNRASAWLDPTGIASDCFSLKSFQETFPTASAFYGRRGIQPARSCTAECVFLRLADIDMTYSPS